MNAGANCFVCRGQTHKYKCPKCCARYCSVACFKKHSESPCEPNKVKEDNNGKLLTPGQQKNHPTHYHKHHHHHQQPEDESQFQTDEMEIQVPLHTLELLGKSKGVLSALRNPHLRTMISYLDSTEDPERDIEAAMAEPIFVEFVDECMKIVDPAK